MKKTYDRARMIEHNKGANAGMLEFRFYSKDNNLLCQRWVRASDFRADCEKKIVLMQLEVEQSIYKGTHELLVGPKIIDPFAKKLKVH